MRRASVVRDMVPFEWGFRKPDVLESDLGRSDRGKPRTDGRDADDPGLRTLRRVHTTQQLISILR